MVKILTKLFLTTLLLNAVGLNAHIFMIEKWNNGSQDIYCLSDYHQSTEQRNKVCNIQRMDIVDAAKKYNACVITEDTLFHNLDKIIRNPLNFDPNENYAQSLDESHFKVNAFETTQTPIMGLTLYCHHAGTAVDNVEFRNLKNISLFNGFIDSKTALTFSGTIKEQILKYNDSSTLNAYYQKKINEYNTLVKPCTNFFNKLCEQNCSLKKALSLVPYDTELNAVQLPHVQLHLMSEEERKRYIVDYYDTLLLDLRIIHSIYTHKKYPSIFVCAGGGHIDRIKPALTLMGFKQVDSYYDTNDRHTQEPTAIHIEEYFRTEHNSSTSSSMIARLFSWLTVTLFG